RLKVTYERKQPCQRGAVVLKDGRRISWLANSADSILLYSGSSEQLYLLPKIERQHNPAEPLFPIWDAEGKEGFIDRTGKTVLPEFDEVGEFSEGLAPVK